MTPADLAALHARAFVSPPPWSERDFAEILALAGTALLTGDGGFLVARLVADEAEILTLAVDPERRRRGTGRGLVARAIAYMAARGATRMHLEVAETNTAARALYAAQGFVQTGRRKGYYRQPDGGFSDAILLGRDLGTAPD